MDYTGCIRHVNALNILKNENMLLPFMSGAASERKDVCVMAESSVGEKNADEATNDIIAVTPGTVITDECLVELVKCAYLHQANGIVIPLMGIGTDAHIPFIDRTVFKGLSADESQTLVKNCSHRENPIVPAKFFPCMYIRHDVMEALGGFDEESRNLTGTLNEFAQKAELLGFNCVVCDSAYADCSRLLLCDRFLTDDTADQSTYGPSGSEESNGLRSIENKLSDYYSYIATNIELNRILNNGRRNILYLLHLDFREDSTDPHGGTQVHVKNLKDELKGVMNVFVAAPDRGSLNLTVYSDDSEILLRFPLHKVSPFFEFHNTELSRIWHQVLKECHIDIVHIHQISNQSFDIFDVAKEYGIPVISSLHDFFYVCPTVKLFRNTKVSCIGLECTSEICDECLTETCGIPAGMDYIGSWRSRCREALARCSVLITPDESVRETYGEYYPELKDKIRVIPHGYGAKPCDELWSDGSYNHTGLRVAFIGGQVLEKGGLIVADIVEKSKGDTVWYIMGGIRVDRLTAMDRPDLIKTGPYGTGELTKLLKENEIDVIGLLSICAETFSYTLTEAVLNRIPVITTDIGALGHRVKAMDCGWTVSTENTADEFLGILKEIRENPTLLEEKRSNMEKVHIDSLKEMADKYADIYKKLLGSSSDLKRKTTADLILTSIDEDQNINKCVEANDLTRVFEILKSTVHEKESLDLAVSSMQTKLDAYMTGYDNALKEIASIKNSRAYKLGRAVAGLLGRK